GEVRFAALVEADDHGVDLLADLEAVRTLFVAVAAEVRALDEGGGAVLADLHLDAAVADLDDRRGDRLALLHLAGAHRRADTAAAQLLDAERDALLLHVDVEHHGLDALALVILGQRLLARHAPGDVGHVDH